MRKNLIVLVLIVVMVSLTSCGMGWENFKKDVKSDLGGGLERTITVRNMFTNDVIW